MSPLQNPIIRTQHLNPKIMNFQNVWEKMKKASVNNDQYLKEDSNKQVS
jgi:hypothetical protein